MLLRSLAVGIMYVCNCSGIVAHAGLILVAKRVLCWAPKTVTIQLFNLVWYRTT
jgi:hypothetical protein